jgi:hypothetical protein
MHDLPDRATDNSVPFSKLTAWIGSQNVRFRS